MIDYLTRSLDDTPYIIFDLENTGGNPEKNGITEVFALQLHQGKILDTFHSLVNPKRSIPPFIRKMTGISNDMVRDQPTIEEIFPSFLEFIGDRVMVSHNYTSDFSFLNHAHFKMKDGPLENYFLCTHLLATKLLPDHKDKSLIGLCHNLGFASPDAHHRATEDTYLTENLFTHLLGRLKESGVQNLKEAIRLQDHHGLNAQIGWDVDQTKLEQTPKKTGVLTFFGHNQSPLFNLASNNMNRASKKLSEFSALPKKLGRHIVKSVDFTTELHPHYFAASLAEKENEVAQNLTLKGIDLHREFIPCLQLIPVDEKHAQLIVGPLKKGCLHAWGPVYSNQDATLLLRFFSQIFKVSYSKKGVTVPLAADSFIDSIFSQLKSRNTFGYLKTILKVIRLSNSMNDRIDSTKRTMDFLATNKQLQSPVDLLDKNGVLLCRYANKTDVYKVNHNVPELYKTVDSGKDDWAKSDECRKLLSDWQIRELTPHTDLQAAKANATLWWIFACTKKKDRKNALQFINI